MGVHRVLFLDLWAYILEKVTPNVLHANFFFFPGEVQAHAIFVALCQKIFIYINISFRSVA